MPKILCYYYYISVVAYYYLIKYSGFWTNKYKLLTTKIIIYNK